MECKISNTAENKIIKITSP